jgi:Sec-independent protein secretion pathway component TatC
MLITPPDVIAQCFFAIPIILSYEGVLYFSYKKKADCTKSTILLE